MTPQYSSVTVPPNTSGSDLVFWVKNNGTSSYTYTLTMSCTGSETCTNVLPTSTTLGPGQQFDADVIFTSGAANTTGTVSLTASGGNGQATGTTNVTSSAGPAPIVGLSPFDADNQDVTRCAAACFAATYAQNTVAYFSLDTPHKVTLAYNSDRVSPRPFVHVNVMHGGDASNLPTAFYLEVKKGDGSLITFLNGEQKLRFAAAAGSSYRLAGQFDAAANGMGSTAVCPITIIVGAEYAGGNTETATAAKLILVNEAASPIARGWTLAGVQRLFRQADGSALITEGDGSAVYFAKSGSSYVAPAGELSTLVLSASAGAFARIYPDSSRVWFDSTTGRMLYVMDPVNVPTLFYYDAAGRVDSIADYLSQSIRLGYGASGLATITDPMGRQTTVTVDGSGRLTAIADPDNASTRFGYDASLRLDSITDRRGATTTLAYDAQSGKLASVTAPAVPIFGQGTVSPVTALAAWQKVSVPYVATSGTPFAPARADTVHGSVTDPGGHQSLFTVGHFGQPVQTTGPLGDTVTVAYNANGQPLAVSDRLGVNASYSYDGTGFMTAATVGGVTTYYRNGGWGTADSVWGAGPARRLFLGLGGRTDSARAGGQYMTHYQYDDWTTYAANITHERVVHTWGAGSNLAYTWYTGTNGNRSRDSIPGGRVTTYRSDAYGRVDSVQAADGVWRTTAFDPINRPINTWDGVHGTPTHYTYDSLYLRRVTDPAGQVYGFSYNALGWVTSRSDPTGRADSLAYDADGLLRQWTNRRGQSIVLTYDALHRRLTRTGGAITADTLSYAADGRTVTASNAAATETEYLNARLQDDSARTVLWFPGGGSQTYWRRYWYSGTSATLDSMRPSGGGLFAVTRGYAYTQSRGTLDSIRLGPYGWTRLVYDSVLSLQKYQFPDAAADSLSFRTVTAQDVAQTGSFLLQDMIHYDALGRVDEIRDTVAQWTRQFRYDSLGHLRWIGYSHQVDPLCYAFDPDSGWLCTPTFDSTRTLSYDTVGNRTDLGGTYTTGNRIATFNGCTYGEDLDGNDTLRACPGQSVMFGWAADGRLTSLAIAGGPTVAFAYDASGRLVRRDVNGTPASYFLWDGEDLLAELGSNAWSQVAQYSYYPGLDRLHAAVDGPWYAQQDVLGNVRFLDSYPGAYASYQYDEQGRLVDSGGNGFSYYRPRWEGALAMAPEAGLYYLRSRWYDTHSGRFLSEDPTGLAEGMNLYTFGDDDPINYADPTGAYSCHPHWVYDSYTKSTSPDGILHITFHGHYAWDECGETYGDDPYFWYTMERTCGYNPSPNCLPPDPQNPERRPAAYTPVTNCGLNRALVERLTPQFAAAQQQGAELGGYYTGPWSSVAVVVSVVPGSRGEREVTVRFPPGSLGTWHTHQYSVGGQGPSVGDSLATVNRTGIPTVIISRDSLFLIRPSGEATGCSR